MSRAERAAEVIAERDERVKELSAKSWSLRQISDELGVSTREVSRARVRLGIQQELPPPLTASEIAQAEALIDEGASLSEVARTVGRTATTWARQFPGSAWSRQQSGAWARFVTKNGGMA